jgi:colicin import membrane protein
MKTQTALRSIAGALLAALLGACGTAPQVAREEAPAPTQSVAQADQRLATVASERAAVEARFAQRERTCYEKFLVTRCLDQAKERRRSALAQQRAIEIEAEHFKRKAKVEERDRALAQAERAYQAEEARLSAQPAPAARPAAQTQTPPPRPAPRAERVARHNEKIRAAEARDQAAAAKRAANVADYNKRKAESEARQAEVARRMAEKAAKTRKEQPAPPASGQ